MDNQNRTCPLKRLGPEDFMVLQGLDVTEDELRQIRRNMAVQIAAEQNGAEQTAANIGPAVGLCDRERCGWWSDSGKCCSIARLGDIADIMNPRTTATGRRRSY